MPPINDNFADRITLVGDSGTWSGSSDGATNEATEPAPFAGGGGASIWFEWTPGFTGQAQIDTTGSTYTGTADRLDTVVDIFTGSTLLSLSLVGGNDDDPSRGNGLNSRAQVDVVASTTYVIRVDGYGGGVDTGDVVLHWKQYTVPPPPTITSFAPLSASPGDTLVITGTNFIDIDRVGFRYKFPFSGNEFANHSFTVDSPTQITVTVPTLDFGAVTGSIVVTGGPPDYVDAITSLGLIIPGTFGIVSVSPSSGPDGTEVTVTGTQFLTSGIDTLRLLDPLVGGTGSIPFTIDSETQLRFTIPDGFSNGGPYRVELRHFADSNPDIDSSAAQTFTIGGALTVSSFSPPSGTVGTTVTVTGSGFDAATSVQVGATHVVFTIVNPTTITFVVPATAVSGPITVTTGGGSATTTAILGINRTASAARSHLWKDRG